MKQQSPELEAALQSPQAAALLKNKAALQQLIQSQDAQRLVALLNSQSGGGLSNAAQQAGKGDPGALMSLVHQLSQSAEGAELMERLRQQLPK